MTENQDRRYVDPEDATPEEPEAESPIVEDSQDRTGYYDAPAPALQPPPPDLPKSKGDELYQRSQSDYPPGATVVPESPPAPMQHAPEPHYAPAPPLSQDRVEPRYEYPAPAYSSASSIPAGAAYPPPPAASQYQGEPLEGTSQPHQTAKTKKSQKKMWDTEKGPLTISAAGLGGLLISLILLFSSPLLDTSVGVGLSLFFTFLFLLFSLGASVWGAAVAVVRLFKNDEDNKGYHAAAILTALITVPLTFFFIIMALFASLSIWFGNIF